MSTARKEKQSFDKLRTSGELQIRVPKTMIDAMSDVARLAWPQEACGLLLGEGAQITEFVEMPNVHPRPKTHFEIDPTALIQAYRQERKGGSQILGYFHSHPKGPASPSETDAAMAAGDDKIWAIWGEGKLALWRSTPRGFEPLSYTVTED